APGSDSGPDRGGLPTPAVRPAALARPRFGPLRLADIRDTAWRGAPGLGAHRWRPLRSLHSRSHRDDDGNRAGDPEHVRPLRHLGLRLGARRAGRGGAWALAPGPRA